jgi:RNA polymerase sigma-70 factor, ECF subfamily
VHLEGTLNAVVRLIPSSKQPSLSTGTELERLFHNWTPYVAGVAVRLMGRDQDIEDVIQDVFVEALKGLTALRDPEAVKGWLAAVTVRVGMKRLRRRRIARAIGLGEEWDPTWLTAPEASPEQRTLLVQVYRMLEEFPAAERVAWSLRYLQGERLEEVASLCHCSLATAKRRIARVQSVMEEALNE